MQAKRGGLRDTDAADLLSTLFKAVLERTGVEPQVRVGSGWGAGTWPCVGDVAGGAEIREADLQLAVAGHSRTMTKELLWAEVTRAHKRSRNAPRLALYRRLATL